LKRHCAEVEQHHQVKVVFSAPDDLDAVSPTVALCLFRVTQQALANAVQHARAHTIQVRLAAQNGNIELAIMDDGVGFVPESRSRHGLGLRSIDERVRLVGGTVRLESQPGRGTDLRLLVPLTGVPGTG
jgi:two-component system sensor histidine kinase UhpB